ncbi:hypothetical protein JOF46_000423 [Paeniglutamicibacter psychrophenolicus]|uniref:Uncharacterized protein n=1 Tax=Paeniglutamicibacter psychrophenolicus TaxID=257454 RepID=A0ABS4W8I3_9MICC|nr:hypothetical protein [Paeniglutamicibacter psychrophenolicus]
MCQETDPPQAHPNGTVMLRIRGGRM